MEDDELHKWFVNEVLALEPQLLAYIVRLLKGRGDPRDVLHDVYEKALEGASKDIPQNTSGYLYAIARNGLITQARRSQVIWFDLVADLDGMLHDPDLLTPERHYTAREELARALECIENLPPRCREMVRLRKVEGLSIREIAWQLGVSQKAVERQVTVGMRALTDFMLGGSGKVSRIRNRRSRPPEGNFSHD